MGVRRIIFDVFMEACVASTERRVCKGEGGGEVRVGIRLLCGYGVSL